MMTTSRNALDCNHNENHATLLKRSQFDIRSSDLDTDDDSSTKVVEDRNCTDDKMDDDYSRFLSLITESNKQTKSLMEEVVDDDDADKDPEYSMFLKAIVENGKLCESNDEVPAFLEYQMQNMLHEYGLLTHTNINFVQNKENSSSSEDRNMQINQKVEDLNCMILQGKVKERSMRKGSLRNNKILERKCTEDFQHNTEVDPCYKKLMDGTVKLEDALSMHVRKEVKHEGEVMSSDSDIMVWDDDRSCSEANNNELLTAKENPSTALKKKLRRILRQPYSRREYKTLSKYVKKQRPYGRLLDLRCRPVTSALDGSTKSMLSCFPVFKKKFRAARHDRPKALNLLRGFRFWLEHLPCDGIFKPWLDKKSQKVLPRS